MPPPGSSARMVGDAMQSLGEATSLELVQFISSDAEIQRSYGHCLQTWLGEAFRWISASLTWLSMVSGGLLMGTVIVNNRGFGNFN